MLRSVGIVAYKIYIDFQYEYIYTEERSFKMRFHLLSPPSDLVYYYSPMTCKVCGKKYHCCGSCDYWGEEWLSDGWCSRECYKNSDRFHELKTKCDEIEKKIGREDLEWLLGEILEYESYIILE